MAKKQQKSVACGRLTGLGDTITEAKADLKKQVENALTGYYTPYLVTSGRYTALVYREPQGWCYRMLYHEDILKQGVHECGFNTSYDSREDAIQSAAFHVLDIGPDKEYHTDEDIPAFLTDKEKRQTLLGNARFRRAYMWAKANKPDGIDNDNEFHSWACNHDRDAQFA